MVNNMKKNFIKLGRKIIHKNSKDLYLIAEIGVNYYDIAKKKGISLIEAGKLMINKAAAAGVDAVKFQTYKAKSLASKYSPAYWDTTKEITPSQFELFKKYDKLDYQDYTFFADECEKLGVDFLSTPFDLEAIDALYDLVPAYKIASADITNKPLIKKIARKNKPILLSTGASNISEIWQAVEWIIEENNNQIVLLHCILSYPTKYKNANLGMIRNLNNIFPNFIIGYSDHTLPNKAMDVLTSAFLLGANIIEKHFTIDKSLKGNDHYHSMDPNDIIKLNKRMIYITSLYGFDRKKIIKEELDSKKYARRSIVAKLDIKCGEVISKDKITVKRPGMGISPEFWEDIVGKRAYMDIKEDEILNWRMIQ